MKSILLKLDDKLFRETEERAKELHTSRNSYIREALEKHNQWLKGKKIEDQLAKESMMLKKFDPDKKLKEQLETASLTDLQKYLDE